VQGVIAAKQEARRLGNRRLRVGFDEVAFGRPDVGFWNTLASLGGRPFADALDYVGVDLYPDVFGSLPTGTTIGQAAVLTLKGVRTEEMPIAGVPASTPIRVTENGWPTIGDRTEARQAAALRGVIEAVDASRGTLNVASYGLFDLRDALTSSANPFDHFGILRDDYMPKPAFRTYRDLIRRLGPR
jgi:hypothetical protein